MKKLLALMLLPVVGYAQPYFLNIPGDGDRLSLSYYTTDQKQCQKALIEYAKHKEVYYIGCDVKPLRDAVNVSREVKRIFR